MPESSDSVITKMTRFLKKDNNLQLAIIVVAAVALIVFILSTTIKPNQPAANAAADSAVTVADASGDTLEGRLEQILSHVDGAGSVRVLVTYATGPEIVPAMSVDTQRNTSEEDGNGSNSQTTSTTENHDPVVVQGENGTEPLVLVQKEPVVCGVLVVAEGASNLEVRLKLMQAVQVALQITADRIEVLPMGNSSNNKEGN